MHLRNVLVALDSESVEKVISTAVSRNSRKNNQSRCLADSQVKIRDFTLLCTCATFTKTPLCVVIAILSATYQFELPYKYGDLVQSIAYLGVVFHQECYIRLLIEY